MTGSGLAVSALLATTLVPTVAAAPLAGLVADRFESVHVLVVASLAQGAVAPALASSADPRGRRGVRAGSWQRATRALLG
jgi:hypothetical protein